MSKIAAPIKVTPPMAEVDLSHLGFDRTDKTEFLVKEARIRGTEVYVTAGLLSEMEKTWGGTFVAVKTITDTANQKVYLFPADLEDDEDDDIVALRKSDTLSSASFSFNTPLQKLKLKLRKDRQIVQVPQVVPVRGLGPSYCFQFAGVRATKRPRAELEGAPAEAKSETKAATKATTAEAKPTKAAATSKPGPNTAAVKTEG